MATIILSVGPLVASKTLSDADQARLIAWAKATYGSNLTNAQAFDAFAQGVFAGLRANVMNYYRTTASAAAAEEVSDFVLT